MTILKLVWRTLINFVSSDVLLFEDGSRIDYMVRSGFLRYRTGESPRRTLEIPTSYEPSSALIHVRSTILNVLAWKETPSLRLSDDERREISDKLRRFVSRQSGAYRIDDPAMPLDLRSSSAVANRDRLAPYGLLGRLSRKLSNATSKRILWFDDKSALDFLPTQRVMRYVATTFTMFCTHIPTEIDDRSGQVTIDLHILSSLQWEKPISRSLTSDEQEDLRKKLLAFVVAKGFPYVIRGQA